MGDVRAAHRSGLGLHARGVQAAGWARAPAGHREPGGRGDPRRRRAHQGAEPRAGAALGAAAQLLGGRARQLAHHVPHDRRTGLARTHPAHERDLRLRADARHVRAGGLLHRPGRPRPAHAVPPHPGARAAVGRGARGRRGSQPPVRGSRGGREPRGRAPPAAGGGAGARGGTGGPVARGSAAGGAGGHGAAGRLRVRHGPGGGRPAHRPGLPHPRADREPAGRLPGAGRLHQRGPGP